MMPYGMLSHGKPPFAPQGGRRREPAMDERRAKRVADSAIEQTYVVMPSDTNGSGHLFGGQLCSWIDVVGGIVAMRHARRRVVTARIDNLNFTAGADLNDVVVLSARLTYVGRTSMEVRVDTYREDLDGTRTPMNHAYLVYVAVDDMGRPVAVPGLELVTDEERAEWEDAEKRNEYRRSTR